MDEQAGFEARAVLAPGRARRSRLALLVPVVALAVVAWAGISGPHESLATAETPDPAAIAAIAAQSHSGEVPTGADVTPGPQQDRPATVFGLAVHPLGEVRPQALGRDDVIAVVGWYVATAITDCPPLPAIYRDGSLPYVRGDADTASFCSRTGVLYASPPALADGGTSTGGLRAVGATIVIGVIVPPRLEVIGSDATEVVVIGRLVETIYGCSLATGCARELLVDHVAWALGA